MGTTTRTLAGTRVGAYWVPLLSMKTLRACCESRAIQAYPRSSASKELLACLTCAAVTMNSYTATPHMDVKACEGRGTLVLSTDSTTIHSTKYIHRLKLCLVTRSDRLQIQHETKEFHVQNLHCAKGRGNRNISVNQTNPGSRFCRQMYLHICH